MKDGIKIFILIVVLIAIVALCIYYGKDQVVDVQNEVAGWHYQLDRHESE